VPLAVTLSPVQNVMVNGTNAWGNVQGVGTTPTVSWDAPATGTANAYLVTVGMYDLTQPPPVAPNLIAFVATSSRTVTLPPGLLTPGGFYVFIITATANAGIDVDHAPLASAYPTTQSQAITGVIQP
jgi:hypothetical protein